MRKAVFCCVSKNYEDVVLPLLHSLRAHSDADLYVGVIGDVSLKGVDFVTQIPIHIDTLRLPNETDYPDEAMWSMGSRFLIHDYLRNLGYDHLLYIDCDTIVIDDLDKVFELQIPKGNIGAVCEYREDISRDLYRTFDDKEFTRRLSLRKGRDDYFNSGVILFNGTDLLFEEYCVAVKKDPSKFRFPDQDFLNEKFLEYVSLPRWCNFFAELYAYKHLDLAKLLSMKREGYRSVILHYHCFCKPWSEIFSYTENVISYQIPSLPYYEVALREEVCLSEGIRGVYKEYYSIQDTDLELLLRQESTLEAV